MSTNSDHLKTLAERMRVGRVAVRRSVKTPTGDTEVELEAVIVPAEKDGDLWDSTLREAKVASHMLALQADIAAHEEALASGTIPEKFCRDQIAAVKSSYARLIQADLEREVEHE